MVTSIATLAGLGFEAVVIASVYCLGLRIGAAPRSSQAGRAFRVGFPVAGVVLIGGLAALTFEASFLVRPTSRGAAPIDPGLLGDLGRIGTVLGLVIAVGLLLWLAVASNDRDGTADDAP